MLFRDTGEVVEKSMIAPAGPVNLNDARFAPEGASEPSVTSIASSATCVGAARSNVNEKDDAPVDVPEPTNVGSCGEDSDAVAVAPPAAETSSDEICEF